MACGKRRVGGPGLQRDAHRRCRPRALTRRGRAPQKNGGGVELKKGYKQTEVGVIPEEWDVLPLSSLIKLQSGYSFRSENFCDIGVPVIRISDIQDGTVVTAGATCHPPVKISSDFLIRDGDFLVAMSGATTGKVGVFRNQTPAYQNQRVGRFVVGNKDHTSSEFVGHLVRSHAFGSQLKALLEQGAQPNVSGRQIESLLFSVPPNPDEQRAIAAALSDVDGLVGGLEQLIAKKRDLKQAAMQQLLTGKKRLAGFRGDWAVKTMGELFKFSGGYSASRDQLSSEGHCYLHYGDIHGATKTFVDVSADYQSIPKLDIPLKRVAVKSLLEDGDVVFVDASEDDEGTSRHVVVVNKENKPFISGLHTIVAKSKTAELVHEYRNYCFQTAAVRQQFLFYAVGTKVSGISKTNIAKLTIPVPPPAEQTAIAEVLSEMDAELAALEQRRDKTRALKQGMMQELLTGKTRLI